MIPSVDTNEALQHGESIQAVPPTQGLEFRQIAGLMAGEVMDLTPGTYEFGSEETGTIGFSFNVSADGSIIVVPGTKGIHLDTERIWDPTPLDGRTINAGSARFQVGRRRPEQRDRREIISGVAPQIHEAIVAVRLPSDTQTSAVGAIAPPVNPSQLAPLTHAEPTTFGGFLGRNRRPSITDLSPAPPPAPLAPTPAAPIPSALVPRMTVANAGLTQHHLSERLLRARTALATQRRDQHPNPEDIARRARTGSALCWNRRSDHWHFGQVTIATADVPWQPRLDNPEDLSETDRAMVQRLSTLPSVPITADLRVGPLGIVGSRQATLACARHIMTSMATLSSSDYLTITVLADAERRNSWDWAHRLPHTGGASESAMPLLVVDGIEQLNDNGFGMALTDPGGVGAVLLANDARSLPPTCSTVMILHEAGTATILNHREGTTVSGATPHGISTTLALETAAHLSSPAPIRL